MERNRVADALFSLVGAKGWLVQEAVEVVKTIAFKRYIEPCVGSAAIFLGLHNAGLLAGKAAWLNDADEPLMRLYAAIVASPSAIAAGAEETAKMIRGAHSPKACYAELRAKWNALPPAERLPADTLVLRRLVHNGVSRYNRWGEMNAPAGSKAKRATMPTVDELIEVAKALDLCVTVPGADGLTFRSILEPDFDGPDPIGEGDLLFVDPPYWANFVAYTATGFRKLSDQITLIQKIRVWAERGATILYCNSATTPIYNLLATLCPGAEVRTLSAPRKVRPDGDRTPAAEILAIIRPGDTDMATRKRKKTLLDEIAPAAGTSPLPDRTGSTWPKPRLLRTNLKGEAPAASTYDFPPLVAIAAPNWSGKTALASAAALAYTTQHPIGHFGTKLAQLAPQGAIELLAEIEFDDAQGSRLGVRVPLMGESSAPQPIATGVFESLTVEERKLILPLGTYGDLLTMNEQSTREAVLARFGTGVVVETPKGMSESLTKLWEDAFDKTSSPAIALARTARHFRDKQPEITREITGLQKQVTALRTEGTAGAEMVPALKAELDLAKAEIARSEGRQQGVAVAAVATSNLHAHVAQALVEAETRAARLAERLSQASTAEEAAHAEVTKIDAALAGLRAALIEATELEKQIPPDENSESIAIMEAVQGANTWAVKQGSTDFCLCCLRDGTDLTAANARIAEALIPLRAADRERVEVLTELVALRMKTTDEIRHFESLRGFADRQASSQAQTVGLLTPDLERTLTEIERLQTEQAKTGENTPRLHLVPPPTDAELKQRSVAEIEAQLALASKAAERQKIIGDVEKQIIEKTAARGEVETMKKIATARLAETMAVIKASAEAAVNYGLTAGFRAVLELGEDDDCRWMAVGSDGRAHGVGAMTGSDEKALKLALMRAWRRPGLPSVLYLDDEDLKAHDNANFTKLLESLAQAQVSGEFDQVIICTWRDKTLIPKSYKIIEPSARPRDAGATVAA